MHGTSMIFFVAMPMVFGLAAHPRDIRLEDIAMDRGALVIVGGITGCEGRLVRKGKKEIIRVNNLSPS